MVDASTNTAPVEKESDSNIIEQDAVALWHRIEKAFNDFIQGFTPSVDALKQNVHEAAQSQAPASTTAAVKTTA